MPESVRHKVTDISYYFQLRYFTLLIVNLPHLQAQSLRLDTLEQFSVQWWTSERFRPLAGHLN
jgi:hypothetical protein